MVAMLCEGQLGGVIFFQDPLDSHAHGGDIEGLLRNVKIYNVMHAGNTVTATMMMHTLRSGLQQSQPELLPSFFKTLECPSVAKYRSAQQVQIELNVARLAGSVESLEVGEETDDIDISISSRGSF